MTESENASPAPPPTTPMTDQTSNKEEPPQSPSPPPSPSPPIPESNPINNTATATVIPARGVRNLLFWRSPHLAPQIVPDSSLHVDNGDNKDNGVDNGKNNNNNNNDDDIDESNVDDESLDGDTDLESLPPFDEFSPMKKTTTAAAAATTTTPSSRRESLVRKSSTGSNASSLVGSAAGRAGGGAGVTGSNSSGGGSGGVGDNKQSGILSRFFGKTTVKESVAAETTTTTATTTPHEEQEEGDDLEDDSTHIHANITSPMMDSTHTNNGRGIANDEEDDGVTPMNLDVVIERPATAASTVMDNDEDHDDDVVFQGGADPMTATATATSTTITTATTATSNAANNSPLARHDNGRESSIDKPDYEDNNTTTTTTTTTNNNNNNSKSDNHGLLSRLFRRQSLTTNDDANYCYKDKTTQQQAHEIEAELAAEDSTTPLDGITDLPAAAAAAAANDDDNDDEDDTEIKAENDENTNADATPIDSTFPLPNDDDGTENNVDSFNNTVTRHTDTLAIESLPPRSNNGTEIVLSNDATTKDKYKHAPDIAAAPPDSFAVIKTASPWPKNDENKDSTKCSTDIIPPPPSFASLEPPTENQHDVPTIIYPMPSNMDIILKDTINGISIFDYFNIAWSEGISSSDTTTQSKNKHNNHYPPLYGPWLTSCHKNNVRVLPWEAINSHSSDNHMEEGNQEHATGTDTGAGAAATDTATNKQYTHQRIVTFDFKKSTLGRQSNVEVQHEQKYKLSNDQCVLHMSISMKGFPYADCFLVEVCHVATAQSGEDHDNNNILNVEIGLNVKFIKSSMMEWKIRSTTTAETTKSQTHLFQTVKDACFLFQSLKNMRLEAKERRKAEATATGEALAENNLPEEIIAQITEPKSEGKENNNIVTSGVPVEEEEILSNITEKDNLSSLAEEIIVSCEDSMPDVTATPDDKKEVETEIIVDKIYTEAEEDKIPMDVATASSPGEEAFREETNVQIESEEKVAGVDIETMEKPAARKDTLITATEKVNPSSLAKEISLSGEESIPIIITAPKESTAEIKDINSIANKMYAKKEAKLSNLTKKKNLFASVEMKKEMTAQHTAQNTSESTEPFQAKEDCHCTWCPKSLYNFFRGSKPKPLFINPLPRERQSALQQLQDDSIRNMRGSVDSLREELLNIMEQGGLSSTKKDLILREVWVIKKSLDRISSISINNLEEESAEACQA